MLIKLDLNGAINKITPEHIFQGSVNVDDIILLTKFPKTCSVNLMITDVDGIAQTPILMQSEVFDNAEDYNIWVAKLNGSITNKQGIIKMAFSILDQSNNTMQSSTLNVNIEESQIGALPPEPTPDVYEQILRQLALKQNIQDKELSTKDKTIVGAINELDTLTKEHTEKIEANTQDITDHYQTTQQNTQDIDELKRNQSSGVRFCGVYPASEVLPTPEERTQFILDNKGRPPRNGDFIKFTLIVPNGNDINYDLYYSENQWSEPAPTLGDEKADNATYGNVKGSLNDDGTNISMKYDINNGIIKNSFYKRTSGDFINVATELNSLYERQNKIVNGEITVGKAITAENDRLNRDIPNTYALKDDVYTKTESDKKYQSRIFSNKYYFSSQEFASSFADTVPTAPPDGKQAEIVMNSIGSQKLIRNNLFVDSILNVTKDTADSINLWLKSDIDTVIEVRVTTYVSDNLLIENKVASVDLSGEFELKADTLKNITINSIYSALGNEEIEIQLLGSVSKEIEIITKDSTRKVISLYSNAIYPSAFNFASQSQVLDLNVINDRKTVLIKKEDWVDNGNGTFTATVTREQHRQAPSNKYTIDLQYSLDGDVYKRLPFESSITKNGDIAITSYNAIDCELIVGSGSITNTKGIIFLENPEELPEIDYTAIGTVRIKQTVEPKALSAKPPKDPSRDYRLYIANDKASTKPIIIQDLALGGIGDLSVDIGKGVRLQWIGTSWVLDENPDKTSEVYDDLNDRPLNDTLAELDSRITDNHDEVNHLTGTVADLEKDNTLNKNNINLKLNAKSIELKEGLNVNSVIEFYKYFYEPLRKGLDDTWEIEVGNDKNTNITDIFGVPYGVDINNSAEFIIKRQATSGIGYTLKLLYVAEKEKTVFIGYVRGWIVSGTSYDKDIHFTGWKDVRGEKWVDDVNGDLTLNDQTPITLNIGEFKNPHSNCLLIEVTKNNHSYCSYLLFDNANGNVAETTVKLDNEDVYVSMDYTKKEFTISKTSTGSESIKLHIFEKV